MRMLIFLALLHVAAVFAIPQPLWGPTGHQISAAIAQEFTSDNFNRMAAGLIPDADGEIIHVASWADNVRSQSAYTWSAPLHYINTPDGECWYSRSRDCKDERTHANYFCVDGAIQNYTNRLSDAQLSINQRGEALKFLVHFVGDIHQPLHVSFASDRGGNSIRGTFMGRSCNLHQVWDDLIISERISSSFGGNITEYYMWLTAQIQTTWSSKVQEWTSCQRSNQFDACSDEWAQETAALACKYAYVGVDGTEISGGYRLGVDYYKRAFPVVDEQLAKAAVRLAHVLSSIFP